MKKYCHLCGALNIEGKSQPWECSDCGNKSYDNSKPTAEAALFNLNGEILLAKRGIAPNKGKIDLPGGFVDYGETLELAISREILEELGLEENDYEPLMFCMSWNADYPFSNETVNTLNNVFTAKLVTDIIEARDDVASVKFYSLDKIDQIDFSYKEYPEIIRRAHRLVFDD